MDLIQIVIKDGKFVQKDTNREVKVSPKYLGILILDGRKEETPQQIHWLACSNQPTLRDKVNAYLLNPVPERTDGSTRYNGLARVDGSETFKVQERKSKKLSLRRIPLFTYIDIVPILYCSVSLQAQPS